MTLRSRPRLLIGSILGVLPLLACDPGLHFRPKAWAPAAEYRWRTTPLPGVELETSGAGGLIGSTGLTPEFTVRNHSADVIVLTGCVLDTKRGRYHSEPIRPGQEQWFTVPPGESKRIHLSFRLAQPIGDVLIDPVALTLTIMQGAEAHSVAVPMVPD